MQTIKSIQNSAKKATNAMIFMGVLALILGIVAVIYPAGFGKISTIVIGAFLIIGGVFRMTFAMLSVSVGSLIMRYVYAILMIIPGIWLIMKPEMGLEVLTVVMAIYFIVDGITAMGYSFSLMPVGGGMFLLFSGLIGILLGVLIFTGWPETSTYVLGTYLGIKLIADGLMLAITGRSIRKSVKNVQTNI
jgi:uncharacterized membrane protein HdeD (DUF308 family)